MLFKWHMTKYYSCIPLHLYLPHSALHLSKIWSWLAWYQCSLLIPYSLEYKMTSQIKHVCQRKMYLSKSKMTPKIRCLLIENSFAFNFIHLIHKACQHCTTQCHCHHLQSVPSFPSHSLLTFPSSLPFYNVSPSVSYFALNVEHFLKPFTVTSGDLCCHAVMIHIN